MSSKNKSQKDEYTYEGHKWNGKVGGKIYCTDCGLVNLNNNLSRWCVDKGCNFRDHPQLEKVVKKFTGWHIWQNSNITQE